MYHDDFSELVLPFLKVSTTTAAYNVLCKVNKLFNRELKYERDIKNARMWFRKDAKRFFSKNTDIHYRKSIRVNNTINFTFLTGSSFGDDHEGTLTFNADKTVSLCITSGDHDDDDNFYQAISFVSRTFPNVKSLEMMKKIFIVNDFHSEQHLNCSISISEIADMYGLEIDRYETYALNQ